MRHLKTITFAASFIVSSFGIANAACSVEDLQAKGAELSQAIQALAAKDPAKVQEISAKMQEAAQKYAGTNGATDEACAYYDELLAATKE